MILLNTDKIKSSFAYKIFKSNAVPLKGKVIGNILIIEDIFDFSESMKRKKHSCLCKCLTCGKVWIVDRNNLFYAKTTTSCGCSPTQSITKKKGLRGNTYIKQKRKALSILDAEYNRQKKSAIFKEDYKRLDDIAFVREFIFHGGLEKGI